MPTSTQRKPSSRSSAPPRKPAPRAPRGAPWSGEITNYPTALKWLYSHVDHERARLVRYDRRTFNLDRMRRLLHGVGDPQEQLRFVHVAGSKGKGSTVAMLASMLQRCGYTIGAFTSPHLVDLRERVQVNGQMISHADITEAFKAVRAASEELGDDRPSFFEIMTAAGLLHFADQAVDLAILEVGLGGRLDSTNVIEPEACGITQISLDHTNILGQTVEEIAAEKAGIMKEGVPVLSVAQEPAAARALEAAAERVGAPLEVVGRDIDFSCRFEADKELGKHARVCLTTPEESYDHLAVPLQGEHQALNCGLALALLHKLRERGFVAPEHKLIEGLAETKLPGRMEIAWDQPRILLDGAHNAASIKALIRSVGAHVPYDSLVVIFGCGEDKDVTGMLKQISLGADKVIFTRAKGNPRALDPAELLTRFQEVSGKMAQTAEKLPDALNLAARAVGREDLICITGSFYLVGQAKKYLADLANKREKQKA